LICRNSDRTLQSVEIALMPRKYEEAGTKALLPPVVLKVQIIPGKEFNAVVAYLTRKRILIQHCSIFGELSNCTLGMPTLFLMERHNADECRLLARKPRCGRRSHWMRVSLPVLSFGASTVRTTALRLKKRELLLEAPKLDATDCRWPFELARCLAQQSQWEGCTAVRCDASGSANALQRFIYCWPIFMRILVEPVRRSRNSNFCQT